MTKNNVNILLIKQFSFRHLEFIVFTIVFAPLALLRFRWRI